MNGSQALRHGACAVITVALSLGGCAEVEPEPDSMPISMYDSPVVASGISGKAALDAEKAPAKREETDSETRVAETSPDEETARPEEAQEATPEPVAPPPSETDSANESEPSPEPALASQQQTADPPATDSESEAEPAPDPEPADTGDDPPEKPSADTSGDAPRQVRTKTADSSASQNDGADRPTSSGSDAARYAAAIYKLNGITFPDGARTDIAEMYRHCRDRDAVFQSRSPAAGDLVFFHNVRDANEDGRNNDWYTWVGLVEKVGSRGTVHVLGYRDGAVRNITLNLNRPDTRKDGGQVVNARLREKREDDPPFTQYLAGQLFAGYCSLLGDRSELLVVDNWQPGMELEPPR